MSREKQIDEMREKIRTEISKAVEGELVTWTEFVDWLTESLYNAGYRKQEWISVEERLPEEDGWYITYTNANGKSNGVIAQQLVTTTIRGKKIRRWEWQTRVSPWIVTHWMPLPEAPKMKGGAE